MGPDGALYDALRKYSRPTYGREPGAGARTTFRDVPLKKGAPPGNNRRTYKSEQPLDAKVEFIIIFRRVQRRVGDEEKPQGATTSCEIQGGGPKNCKQNTRYSRK